MVDNFELTDGVVDVLTKSGGRHPIPVPLGYTDIAFRNALATVYTLFIKNGKFPSVDECFRLHSAIPKATFSALMLTDEFRSALAARGVTFDPASGLTLEQQMALAKLSDVTDTRSLGAKLKDLKVPMPRYQGWLKQPLFVELLDKATKDAYADYLPDIRRNMIGRAMNGDQRAAELVFAKTGEYDPNKRTLQDAQSVVMTVVNAVMTHVRDKDTRQAILDDIRSATVSFDVMHQRELEEPHE